MGRPKHSAAVVLEIGDKRTFAAALDWPGWCRSGRDETQALQALLDYAPRYARALQGSGLGFHPPGLPAELEVIERLDGDASTDFGAPGQVPSADRQPVDAAALERMEAVLRACWQAFDAAAAAAEGRELSKGPRGGGRELEKVVQHVLEVDQGYLARLGGKAPAHPGQSLADSREDLRAAILTTLGAAVRGEIAAKGPRGGERWTPRYFVRRMAWHELDHAWEIEDRAG